MAGVGGFFVKGLASGFLQGQQIQEMNWQRKEKERIKKEEDALMETLTMTGKKFSSYYADYNISEDERLQAIATWSALSYEAKELLKGAYDGVMNYNKEAEEQSIATVKAYREAIEGIDFDLSTIPEISDFFRGQIKSPNGLKYFDAADRMLQKNREALQKKKVESFPSLDELYKKHPGAEGEYSATEKGYIVKPTETKELSAADKKYNWAIEHHALPEGSPGKISDEQLFKFMGVDVSDPEKRNTIQQRLDEMDKLGATTEEKKNYILGGGGTTTPTSPAVESIREDILNADNIEDARRMHQNNINKYGDTSGIDDVDKYWTDGKVADLDNLVAVLDEITAGTPENRNVKGKKEFAFEINGNETEKTGEEWYKEIYESYIALLKLLEKQGVDISQYKKLKPLLEIKKIKFGGFVGAGVETGDLISIYY